MNTYSYARNNPTRFIDPDGESIVDTGLGILDVGVGLVTGTVGAITTGFQVSANLVASIWDSEATARNDAIQANIAEGIGQQADTALRVVNGTADEAERDRYIGQTAAGAGLTLFGANRFTKPKVSVPKNIGTTLNRIDQGGKFPHRYDGTIFKNREGNLPQKEAGYYKEYVHPTKGIDHAGQQRVITGKNGEAYYTPDHYKSFKKIDKKKVKKN